jgi:hypothetical protein
MRSGFWEKGNREYRKGLKEHYDGQLAELKIRLKQCTEDADREEIRQEIRNTRAEYKQKRSESGKMIH